MRTGGEVIASDDDFVTFDIGRRVALGAGRLTVRSLQEANTAVDKIIEYEFSELDEKFQFLIKALRTNSVAENDLLDRVIRGLQRKEKEKFVKELEQKITRGNINGKEHLLVEINNNENDIFIEKIIRGIFFYHNEIPAKGIIQSISKRILN